MTVALSVMPNAFYRLLAFPNGIAMIALGFSLWHEQRTQVSVLAPSPVATAVDLVDVR